MTRIDQLIDDVARRMTSARPAADFRARTLERIDARRAHTRWIALAAATAVAGIAVTGWLSWRRPDAPRQARVEPAVSLPVSRASSMASHDARSEAAADRARSTRSFSTEEERWRARRVPPLARPVPIEAAAIQPAPVDVPLLELKPLVTPALTIEPLAGGG